MDTLYKRVEEKLSGKRYEHTLGVIETAINLGKIHGVDLKKIEIAALFHDYAKDLSLNEAIELMDKHGISLGGSSLINLNLIHGKLASFILKDEFGIYDEDILSTITYHTTGRDPMSKLEKIIYLADTIEPSRNFDKLNLIRQMAQRDLDKAVLMAMDTTLEYLIRTNKEIDTKTIEGRNHIIKELDKRLVNEKK